MSRILLAPGRHRLVVNFKNGAGSLVSSAAFNDVVIRRGKRTYLAYRTAL